MRLSPGSLPWLVLWDLRIRLREGAYGSARMRTLLIYAGVVLAAHGLTMLVLRKMLDSPKFGGFEQLVKLNGFLLTTLLFFMLMAATVGSFRLIFAGRELSLQLSSPIPFQRLLWMRALGLVFTTWSISILLVVPVANAGALLGEPRFLLLYPVTIAMAAVTAAFTLLFMSSVVRVFGVPRARRVLQLLQGVVPLAFVSISLFGRLGSAPSGSAARSVHSQAVSSGLEHISGVMQIPAQALTGEALALAITVASAALALLLSTRLAAYGIFTALQVPDAAPRTTAPADGRLKFRSGAFRALALKEWRTLLRDPRLAIALFVQPLLTLPAFYLGFMNGRFQIAGAVAMATFLAAQMSQYVANLMISSEEAPALLGLAPIPRARLIRWKCLAAVLPILAVLSLPAVWIATQDLWAALVYAACCLGAAFCACAVEVARPYPSPRRSFVAMNTARRKRDPLDVLSVAFIQLGWTAGAWFLADRSVWGALIVFAVIIVPFVQWWRDANKQALLGY